MKPVFIIAIVAVAMIGVMVPSSFAEESIDFEIDKEQYMPGDTIFLNGKSYSDMVMSGSISIQMFNPNNEIVYSSTAYRSSDGIFSKNILIEASMINENGRYHIRSSFSTVSMTQYFDIEGIQNSSSELHSETISKSIEDVQMKVASFVDQSKDPQHYIDRYFNESTYKEWFDENYPQYSSIYEAVGLSEPEYTAEPEYTPEPTSNIDSEPIISQNTISNEKIEPARYDSDMFSLYDIDSRCKLTYVHLKHVSLQRTPGYSEKYGGGFLPIDVSKSTDITYLENIRKEIFEKRGLNIEDARFLDSKTNQEIIDEFQSAVKGEHYDRIKKFNSIDPKLDTLTYAAINLMDLRDPNIPESSIRNAIQAIYALEPKYYYEDLECGKKLHEEFSNEMYDSYKTFQSEEFAQQVHNEIKSEIYSMSSSNPSTSNDESGGGCLIATATYGSEMATEVQQLRELRDNQLLQTESGTAFMGTFNDIYYSFSPTIADMERKHPMFKEAVKIAITPMISTLSLMENANSESEVLGIGISVIALNLGMYLGVPAIVVVGIRKRF